MLLLFPVASRQKLNSAPSEYLSALHHHTHTIWEMDLSEKWKFSVKGRGNLERALKNGAEPGKGHQKRERKPPKGNKVREEGETGKGKRHRKIERKPEMGKGIHNATGNSQWEYH